MEMNVKKKKGNENLKATISNTGYERSKTNGYVEYFKYLDSMINYARCTCEIKSRIAMAKAAFNKNVLFTSILDLNLRKKLVESYIWRSIAL
jgi:hypothetical protein